MKLDIVGIDLILTLIKHVSAYIGREEIVF